MRCPECGARNIDDAPWCTQCYAGFTAGDAAVPPAENSAPPPTPRPAGDADASRPRVGEPEGAPPDTSDRDVRVRDQEVEWRCGACGSWTPLTVPTCATCAGPRAGFGPADQGAPQQAPAVAFGPAMVASALLPGVGHLLRAQVGTGLARLLLWVLWGGSGVAMVVSAGPSPAAVVLVLAALAVWVVSLVDLQRHAAGRSPLAGGRVLAWSVLGVTLVLVGAVLASTDGRGPA